MKFYVGDSVTVVNINGMPDEDLESTERFLGESGIVVMISRDTEDPELTEYLIEFDSEYGDWFLEQNLELT